RPAVSWHGDTRTSKACADDPRRTVGGVLCNCRARAVVSHPGRDCQAEEEAAGLAGTPRAMPSPTLVLLGGNRFHVIWSDADAVSTEMIQLQPLGDWAYRFLIPGSVGSQPPALMEHATTASICGS